MSAAMEPGAARAVVFLTSNGVGNAWVPDQVLGLRARGVPVELHALHAAEQDFHGSERIEALRAETHRVYPVAWAAVVRDLLLAPFRFRGRLLGALASALRPGEPTAPTDRLRLLVQLAVAVSWASGPGARAAHVHADMAHSPASVGMLVAQLMGVGFSFTGHANDLFERRVALRRKLARANFVHCISRFHRDLYLREGGRPEQMELVYLGTEVARFARVAPFEPAPGTAPVVLAAGRLVPKKGFDVLLEACALLRGRDVPFRLLIAGSGPERDRLRTRAAAPDLAGVAEITGEALLQRELPAFLGAGSVFCLPCVRSPDGDMDGLPLVLVEAMAAGLPCVSTRLVGIPDLIADGETGLLAEPDDASGLADRLEVLLGDAEQRRRLGEAGRRAVTAGFDQAQLLDRLAALFRERLAT